MVSPSGSLAAKPSERALIDAADAGTGRLFCTEVVALRRLWRVRQGDIDMKIGLSLTTSYPPEEPVVARFRQLVEQVEAARDHGFHSIWVGDHHVTPHVYYQSIPTIARLSAHAGSLQIGPFLLLPLYHPVLLAEQMATLDVIAEGRLTLMVALGWQPEAYAAFGVPWKERVPRFEEAIEILRQLFDKDAADHLGRFHRFDAVTFQPKPVQRRIPLWIGASAEPAIRRAARLGDAWIIGPLTRLDAVKAQMAVYHAALQAYGRAGAIDEFPMRRDVFVAEDRATALRIVEPVLQAGYRGVSGDPLEVLIVGGPQDCVDRLEQLRALGVSHVLMRFIVQTQAHVLRAIQIIGEQVIPRLA
jgi:alkanesulfonate monooxygenase SsuD/methylene tetrahydromethanopterin reductase-like flavin-dependent oxidoreductase (luciferase family)